MKIINIAEDEKFIDSAIEQFKEYDTQFCILSQNTTLNYIKTSASNIIVFNDIKELIKFVNNSDCDYVVLHSFYFTKMKNLVKINKPIIACSWGYDIYTEHYDMFNKAIPMNLYKPLTSKLIKQITNPFKWAIKFIHDILIEKVNLNYKKFLNKINYLSTILPDEFDIINSTYPHIKPFPFKYINMSDINIPFIENKLPNRNILIGNSRNMWNNHLDILNLLENKKICCNAYIPISYPVFNNERDNYIQLLKNEVKNYNYVNCIFIEKFMDRQEYFNLINNCSIAVFGSLCQNGLGNIYQMFRTGKKVFFYKDSILYNYFKNNNLNIYSIESDINNDMFNNILPIDKQKQNYIFTKNDENYNEYIKKFSSFLLNLK